MFKNPDATHYYQYVYALGQWEFPGKPLFAGPYTQQAQLAILGALRYLLPDNIQNSAEMNTLQAVSVVILGAQEAVQNIQPMPISDAWHTIGAEHAFDLEVLLVVMLLCHTEGIADRLARLLPEINLLHYGEKLAQIIHAYLEGDWDTLQDNVVIGHGYQNLKSLVNGIEEFGLTNFDRQMRALKENRALEDVLARFQFIKDLPAESVGGTMWTFYQQYDLKLFGDAGGLPEFYLWHELSHVLSDNRMHYKGELLANAYTVGYSKAGKMSILLFGLIQFNLAGKLSLLSGGDCNKFNDPSIPVAYFENILKGERSTLDLLDVSTQFLVDLLPQDLGVIRKRYKIKP